MAENPAERLITPTFDRRGNPEWKSTMSAPDNSVAAVHMIPDRIIPVIFVPGVMGSNLRGRGQSTGIPWRLDSATTAGKWALPKYDAEYRKKHLTPNAMEVDDEGALPINTAIPAEELKRRGWGEVGSLSYSEFLSWLETALNDFDRSQAGLRSRLIDKSLGASKGERVLTRDAVALSYRYRFAVHACGYNWLDDNAVAAERLKKKIVSTVRRYVNEKKMCEKVILVTHSMGGLVARHCSEVLGMRDHIMGIVHGVMPAIGAAAVYRRMKAGTENPALGPIENAKGAAVASALGNDAAEMTAVLSGAPGPLQLLPTPEYGNGWLCLRDGTTETRLPKGGDPYLEIYTVRDKWWGLCEDHLINPLNQATDSQKRTTALNADWRTFETIIKDRVRPFHRIIQAKYHPNTHIFFGSDPAHRAFGDVTWQRQGTGRAPTDTEKGTRANLADLGNTRNVRVPLMNRAETMFSRVYAIGPQEEDGDGTVPHRSGVAPSPYVKSVLKVAVGHEPAFKDSEAARQFTLRAIVQISDDVNTTSLRY
jgi:hypothetical protein